MAVPDDDAPEYEDLPAAEAAQAALDQLASLTGKQTASVTAIAPTDDGWDVEVEVLEERRIPSTMDVLAVFEAQLDTGGDLVSYRRTRRYTRGQVDWGVAR